MILVPTLGMVLLASSSGVRRWSERRTAATLSAEAHRMDELMTASNAVWHESVQALALSIAGEMGAGPERLLELYGVDFLTALAEARTAVDANRVLQTEPTLADGLRALRAERSGIDAGTLSSARAGRTFDAAIADVDDLWQSARRRLERTIDSGSVDGPVLQRIEALRAGYDAFVAGGSRIGFARELARGEAGASVRHLIESDARLAAATAAFEVQLGGRSATAYWTVSGDPAARGFDRVVDGLIVDGLAGRPSRLVTDGVAFGAAFVDAAAWLDGSAHLVAAASADLGDAAAVEAAARSGEFWYVMTIAGVALVVSMAAVALVSRAFTRPLDRIASVVQAVRDGGFDIPRVPVHGPRELSDTVTAVNDMAASIDESSHDPVTDLLNRRAALDAVGRDLARARRNGDRVMAIFLDVDGLKEINDVHGHRAGDRALALVADALRHTCRDGDVLARLGGDEFLVAGIVRSDVDVVEAQAERIREAVGRTILWCGDVPITLRCSVGVAVNEPGSLDVEALLADADTAMYLVKVAGRAG